LHGREENRGISRHVPPSTAEPKKVPVLRRGMCDVHQHPGDATERGNVSGAACSNREAAER